MQLISSNASDIQKYYEGSYVKLPELGDNIYYIRKVNSEGVYFADQEETEGVIWLSDSAPYNLDMVLPNKAMYQMGSRCYSLSRIPARQYHRGITAANCQVRVLGNDGWTNAGVNFGTLRGYVNKPRYRPLAEVVKTITDGSEAISPRFAYQPAKCKLWCDNKMIATINPKLNTIGCNRLLVPEITAFLARTNSQNDYKVVEL